MSTTTTATVPVSDLSGPALDWAVAKCEQGGTLPEGFNPRYALDYSSNWSFAGPIIEREKIGVDFVESVGVWQGLAAGGHLIHRAQTATIAAMRCYVASKLGKTVDVPSELV